MRKRRSGLTPTVALKLAELWPTDTTTYEMGDMFGVTASSVTRWAKLMGLPRKPYPEHKRDSTRFAIATANRKRCAQEEIEKGARFKMEYEPVDAAWWRCPFCTGRSSSREGHELCVNREAA